MPNIYDAGSAGSHHHIGITVLTAGTVPAINNLCHRHTPHAPQIHRGCHDSHDILNTARAGTITE